jgi:tetratricopeptide (TPR) repeat protein
MKRELSKVVAVFCAAATVLASSALAKEPATSPDARERASSIALVVFQDLPGGSDILTGHYQDGLSKASAALADQPYQYRLELETNICAANVKLGQFDSANTSCEAALDARPRSTMVMTRRHFLAVAHVNHGVVHLVQGDRDFAIQEFDRARAMFPGLRVAASNLTLTEAPDLEPHIEVGPAL